MSGPITPHIEITPHADGVHLKLKHVELVLPPQMARDVGQLLIDTANAHDPLGVLPLPEAKVKGKAL
jgi:hypothetical protein